MTHSNETANTKSENTRPVNTKSVKINSENEKINAMNPENIELTDQLVAQYLEQHNDFFNRQADLLTRLRLPDQQRGTVSLVERQLMQQREKIHQLQEEITQLMSVANANEQLFDAYSNMYLTLIDCNTITSLLDCLHQAITQLLSLDTFKLWLPKADNVSHDALIKADCNSILAERFKDNDYYFGRLQQSEQQLIFGQHTAGSVVLVRLTYQDQDLGFLAINSKDVDHFDPKMDTLLLSQFKKLLAKLLHEKLTISISCLT